jgi:diacylglycerol O-acyltransferase
VNRKMNGQAHDDPALANARAWAQAPQWGAAPRMNDLETLMWRTERHPARSSTIGILMVLDRIPEWDRWHAAHEWAAALVPRLRDRVMDPALPIGPPAWVPDPAFDLDYHVRRTRLPGPGGMAELLEFVQGAAMVPFDRTRPLWESTLIEGLSEGKAAYYLKLHHSLTDGMGGIQLLSMLQSRTREHTPKGPLPEPAPPSTTSDGVSLVLHDLAEQARLAPARTGRLISSGVQVLGGFSSRLGGAVRFAGSLRRTLTPPPSGGSPLLRNRTGTAWRLGALECPLDQLRAAAKAAGGSVNDAYIAALLGGMRRYHEHFGVELDELPIGVPLSLRKADDPMGGNKFAGGMFAAPMGTTNPAERIAIVRGAMLSLRIEPAIDSFSFMAPTLNRAPSAVATALIQAGFAADLSASNVPGVAHPVYMAGALVERTYPYGPLPGVAVMAAMVSHDGTCCIGINCDATAVTDPTLLFACMREGLDEVLALAAEPPATADAEQS